MKSNGSRTLALAALLVLCSCQVQCGDCGAYGAGVEPAPASLGAVSMKICVDTVCRSSGPEGGRVPIDHANGGTLTIAVTVTDSAGAVIGAITEKRTVGSQGRCACGFSYAIMESAEVVRVQ
jgi:hypothetical protein